MHGFFFTRSNGPAPLVLEATMTRKQLTERLAARSGLTPKASRAALDALFGTADDAGLIAGALRDGERIQLAGFGTFEARARRARPGYDPRTRAPIVIPAGIAPVFRPGTSLKSRLRASGAKPATSASDAVRVPARRSTELLAPPLNPV
jgi:DNA-binding protein HU-beta